MRWRCKRCKTEVLGGKCECTTGPSPWEPIMGSFSMYPESLNKGGHIKQSPWEPIIEAADTMLDSLSLEGKFCLVCAIAGLVAVITLWALIGIIHMCGGFL